jgi:hypothetical protein
VENESGTLEARLIVPPGAPIARLYPHFAQEWVEPRIPDPEGNLAQSAWERHEAEGRSDLLADGSFRVQPHGEGQVLLWLDFRPSAWEPGFGWEGILESDLAVGLGKVTVPDRTVVRRDFDLRDRYPGAIDVIVRVHGAPAPGLRVTLCVGERVDEVHARGLEVARAGRSYSGGTSEITASDGHARFPHMFAGEWTCYVRPVDRSWISLSPNPAIVETGNETSAAVDVALARHELRFVTSDLTSVASAHLDASPMPLANTRIRWFQRTELGPLGYGHATTDGDGALSLDLPPGVFDFEVDDSRLESRPTDDALRGLHRLSRVEWTPESAAPEIVRLRVP